MGSESCLKILLVIAAAVVAFACASCFKSSENAELAQNNNRYNGILPVCDTLDLDQKLRTAHGLTKDDLRKIIDSSVIFNTHDPVLSVKYKSYPLQITTSIDPAMQASIKKMITRSTARQVAVVVLEPQTGRIISMAGFDRDDTAINPCTSKCFPAASIFKMITAAAAIEARDFRPDTTLRFNGRKHTLYKSQLKNIRNRYTASITLMDSFAQSVNPVFGKIGIFTLGRNTLEKYAYAFGFERNIAFELPVAESRFTITDSSYHIAEIASGFNRETVITPLHGALITAAAINSGTIMEPAVIDFIEDMNGRILYENQPELLSSPITPDSAGQLKRLLEATVKKGTARKSFRGWRRDRVLSKLDIGGKTGTIDSTDHTIRYDWFCGFAQEKDSGRQITVAVLVGHAKPKLDVRASMYARSTIRNYFAHTDSIRVATNLN